MHKDLILLTFLKSLSKLVEQHCRFMKRTLRPRKTLQKYVP